MTTPTLEQRVAILEREIAELKRPRKDWRKTIGMFTDNPAMLSLFEQTLKTREAERVKARKSTGQSRRSKA